jgi:hypothetical protein
VSYINTLSPTAVVTVVTPSLFHALACIPGDHAAGAQRCPRTLEQQQHHNHTTNDNLSDAPPHILAIASSYGPKFFLATFDVTTSVLTPLASFPNTTDV